MKAETYDQAIYVRVTARDLERLDAIADGTRGLLGRTTLARAAMRLGLDAIEADPAILLRQPAPKRGGARPGAGRKPKS